METIFLVAAVKTQININGEGKGFIIIVSTIMWNSNVKLIDE